MTEKYEPSSREVRAEIWRGLKDSCREKVKKGEPLKEFAGFFGGIGMLMVISPYAVPTAVRVVKDTGLDDGIDDYSLAQNMGGYAGALGGFLADAGQVAGYIYCYNHGCPEIIALPVTTNVVSGIYELGRIAYKNARQRAIERHAIEIPDSSSGSTD